MSKHQLWKPCRDSGAHRVKLLSGYLSGRLYGRMGFAKGLSYSLEDLIAFLLFELQGFLLGGDC